MAQVPMGTETCAHRHVCTPGAKAYQDVPRLHIAMHDARGVCRSKATDGAVQHLQDLQFIQAARGNGVLKVTGLVRHDVAHRVLPSGEGFGLDAPQNRDDVRVVEPPEKQRTRVSVVYVDPQACRLSYTLEASNFVEVIF